jgi:heme oxygenase
LSRETKHFHAAADNDRLAMLGLAADRAHYASFLTRVYGFEAPLEATLLMTDGLDQWLDMRDRGHLRLLRADLQALGFNDLNALSRCPTISPFRHPAEALSWIYAVERNTLLQGLIERHLRSRLSEVLKAAGCYLAGQQRSNGQRIRELGTVMDRIAKDSVCAERIVVAAKAAFRTQHHWYEVAVRSQPRVPERKQHGTYESSERRAEAARQ